MRQREEVQEMLCGQIREKERPLALAFNRKKSSGRKVFQKIISTEKKMRECTKEKNMNDVLKAPVFPGKGLPLQNIDA